MLLLGWWSCMQNSHPLQWKLMMLLGWQLLPGEKSGHRIVPTSDASFKVLTTDLSVGRKRASPWNLGQPYMSQSFVSWKLVILYPLLFCLCVPVVATRNTAGMVVHDACRTWNGIPQSQYELPGENVCLFKMLKILLGQDAKNSVQKQPTVPELLKVLEWLRQLRWSWC